MPIRVTCPSCGRSGRVPDHALGKNISCPACRHRYPLTAAPSVPDGLELLDDDEPPPPPKPSDPRFGPLKKPLAVPPERLAPSPLPSAPAPRRAPAKMKPMNAGALAASGLTAVALTGSIAFFALRKGSAPAVAAAPAVAPAVKPLLTSTAVAPEPDFATAARVSATAPGHDVGSGRTVSTAEIVAEADPSIALIKGKTSSGTGFLVGPGLVATNAHVVDDEFISNLEVRFPSADAAHQGPVPAELLYEDARRDLAFLAVKTDLNPLRVADSYKFRKGEEITVIGSPGIGDGVVLENAISRGVMSTKVSLEGKEFYQLGIAVNPGNSGGPVFDSSGRVIGVVTLKMDKQEALAFCVPVEDLRSALSKLAAQSPADSEQVRSRHRVVIAVKGLGTAGAIYSIGIDLRRSADGGAEAKENREKFEAVVAELDKALFSTLPAQVPGIRNDPLLDISVRAKVGEIADNFNSLKAGYDHQRGAVPVNDLRQMKQTHRRLVTELAEALKLEVPTKMMVAFDDRAAAEPSYAMGGFGPPTVGSLQQRMLERHGRLGRPPNFPATPGPPSMTRPGMPPIGPRGRIGPGSRFGRMR